MKRGYLAMCFMKKEGSEVEVASCCIELCEVRLIGLRKEDLKMIEDYMKEASTYVFRKEEYRYLLTPQAARSIEEKADCEVIVGPTRVYPSGR